MGYETISYIYPKNREYLNAWGNDGKHVPFQENAHKKNFIQKYIYNL